MNLRNLNANKNHKVLIGKLNNKKILNFYNIFEKDFAEKDSFAVAVSGGPDSLALAFLTKIYSLKKQISCKFFIVDHKLREESTKEAKKVKKKLKECNIHAQILTWIGEKPYKNVQSLARKKRYELLFSKCKQFKINKIVLGHHLEDLIENFFIRMTRGSGLKGLVSLEKKNKIQGKYLLRPLLNFRKKDLIYISKNVFNFFVKDPSNDNEKFKRIRIRKLINELEGNGLDKDKLFLTIKNLKKSNRSINFYVEQNKNLNSNYCYYKKELILNQNFFNHSYEVIFRSISDLIQFVGGKYNAVRGKKIDNILMKMKKNSFKKATLGGCIIKKVSQTVILSKEH